MTRETMILITIWHVPCLEYILHVGAGQGGRDGRVGLGQGGQASNIYTLAVLL